MDIRCAVVAALVLGILTASLVGQGQTPTTKISRVFMDIPAL